MERAPYDFVVMAPGGAVKVQVKSASVKMARCHKVGLGKGDPRLGAYREGDFDVLAVYVPPTRSWYLLRQSEIKASQLYLGEKDGEWLENWEIFEVS